MNTTNNRDAIEALLHTLGVHDGFPVQRRALATALDIHGLTSEDVQALADAVASQRRKDSDTVPAILAKLLSDPKATKGRLDDIMRGRGLRAQKAEQGEYYPGRSLWKQPGSDDGCGPNLARHRRVAYALIKVEHKSPHVAAEVLGCSPAEAERLADHHLADLKADREAATARPPLGPEHYTVLASGLKIRARN